ncbi:hypothetical protein HYU23_01550 [Candidatus Woesearchaeota archaeon]|nr:hypothetical protein [Candidatus Woesearchaeota archaeon]
MTQKFYLSKGIIPVYYNSINDEKIDFSKDDPITIIKKTLKSDPNRRLYDESTFNSFRKEEWFKENGWLVYELRRHEISEEIPTYKGWTPSFDFINSSFKFEDDVSLIEVGKPSSKINEGAYQVGDGKVIKVDPSKLNYARANVGSIELIEANKNRIEKTFDRLNEARIDFILFRTYRAWPAVWDNICFFSIGDFENERKVRIKSY